VCFPRLVVPASGVIASFVNFVISAGLMALMMDSIGRDQGETASRSCRDR